MSTPTPMNPQPPPRRSVEPSGPPADLPTQPAEKLEATFHAALSRPPAERDAYLAGACAGEEELLREVRALLKAHEEAGDFLSTGTPAPAVEAQMTRLKPEEAGERIGPYKLLQQIGEGGFGTVWMAEQEQPVRRRVALKVIKLGMDTKHIVARFEQERQALAMMDHPNIAKVFDAGATPTGRPYFVMELVRGIKITDYCDQANLPTAERLQLFIAVCHAVQHAHQKGIIHRDLKPSNILVTLHDGVPVPKVIDFGVAKATQQRLTDLTVFTQFEQMIGTPLYMSPEQAEMSGLDIDTRSDIYSLGVLLYELLTGRTPFDPQELLKRGVDEIRRAIREQEPPRPSTALSTMAADVMTAIAQHRQSDGPKLIGLIRGDLDWIVMKAIEKNRTRRYDTANAFAEDIQRHLTHEPVVARPPSQLYRFQKAYHRNKLAFGAAAAVIIALVMGLGLAMVGWRQARAERDGAELARRQAETARAGESAQRKQAQTAQAREAQLRVQAETQELAARHRAYAADMNLVQEALAAHNLNRARYLLDRQRPPGSQGGGAEISSIGNMQNLLTSAATVDLRGWEWRYLWQRCRGDALFKIYQNSKRVLFAGFSSDGKVATLNEAGVVSLWDTTTKAEVKRFQDQAPDAGLRTTSSLACISNDGEWVAAVAPDKATEKVTVWNIATKEVIAVLPIGWPAINSIAFSPDKKMLAVFAGRDGVSLWDLDKKQRQKVFPPAPGGSGYAGSVRFSPDGSILAIGDTNGRVRLMETKTYAETVSFTGSINQRIGVMALAFSPDSRVLAVGTAFAEPQITLWDVPAKAKLRILDGHKGFVSCLAFSPDGKTLASASGDQTIKLWDTTTWKEEITLMGHVDEVWSVGFSRDGGTLVSGGKDGSVYVWPVYGARTDHASLGLPEGSKDWDFSPNGESLITITSDGGVSVWDMATGQKKETLTQLGTNNTAINWSETGDVVIGADQPSQIKIWNVARNSVVEYPLNSDGHLKGIFCLTHTRKIITIHTNAGRSGWTFKCWDLPTGRELSSFTIAEDVSELSLSLNEHLFALGIRGGKVIVRNLETGKEEHSFVAYAGGLQGMAIFPDGKLLATASVGTPIVKVWDLATQREVALLRGHNLIISRITVSPDGQRLATSTIGHEAIKLWDTISWEEVADVEVPDATVAVEGFLPDGNTLVAYDTDHKVHLWCAPSWAKIEAAEKADRK